MLLLLLLDQLSKVWAVQGLPLNQPRALVPGLNLTLAHNVGAAFSLFSHWGQAGQTWVLLTLAAIVALGVGIWWWRLPAAATRLAWALTLVFGGACGNLLDRVRLGYVVDFIDVYYKTWHWPIFNLADTAICLGAALLFLDVVQSARAERKAQ